MPDLSHSKQFSTRILEWMRGRRQALIVTHDNPDPDSLASALALRHLLLNGAGLTARIAFGGIIGRSENRAMVHELEIDLVRLDGLDLDSFDVVCMVDTQPGTGNNSWPLERPVHLIIDHHPRKARSGLSPWVDIREGYGACATILGEYLISQEMFLSTRMATALFYAIKTETQDLGREWARPDREMYLRVFPLSNNRILSRIIYPKVPRQYFRYVAKAIDHARTVDDLLIFNLRRIDNPDMVAEMADFLLRMEGINCVLGMGWYEGTQILSLRTLDCAIVAGKVIREALIGLGSAGGHGMMAGGQIRNVAGDDAHQDAILDQIQERFLMALRENRPLSTACTQDTISGIQN